MPSAWVEHIKEFAKRKGLTYGCALSDPECSKEYQAKKPPKTSKKAGGAKSAGGAGEEEKKYDIVKKILMELDRRAGRAGNDTDPFGSVKDLLINPEKKGKTKKEIVDSAYEYFQSHTNINYDILHSVLMKKLFLELKDLMVAEKENISMEISEKKARGRPKKYATEEERKKAKSAKTIESNKRKKAEGKSAGGAKLKESREKPTGKGMKGGMFPKDFMDGIGKSAGGARRDTTPPPTRPLTQAQGDAILRAINLPKRRRGRELGRVLDDIEGGGDMERMVRRFEGFVSGFNQPPMVRKIMLKFRRAYDESIMGATDSEGSSGEGAGLLKDAIAKNAEAKEKGLELLPEPMKRKIKQARATEKLLADNKAKILAEDMKTGSYGGGLLATHSAEDAGGLTHIYPLSRANILEMCKHLI